MIIEKNQLVETPGKKPILMDSYYVNSKNNRPTVIFCHGYKGFKDWGAWHLVAESFARAGFHFVKFNFSHNGGTPEQPIDFPDLNAFANNNFSKELDDLRRVIDFLGVSEVSLIGHSRGSGIVIITAQEDVRVKQVITWAGVSDYKIRFQEGTPTFAQWKETGVTYVENSRTKQQLPHNWQFYEDYLANEERLTIRLAAQALTKPFLVVHGDADTTVGLAEAKALHSWNAKSSLVVIPGADHVFGAKHPWKTLTIPPDLQAAMELSIEFLNA